MQVHTRGKHPLSSQTDQRLKLMLMGECEGRMEKNTHKHCTNCGSNDLNPELKHQSMVVFFTKKVILVIILNQLFLSNQDDFSETEKVFYS